jgi:hypothetical protein
MKNLPDCPFTGKIVSTKRDGGGALGFKWDIEEIRLEIKRDWKVYNIIGAAYGFVGKDGIIYKGGINLDGSVDPVNTFFEKPIARIDKSAGLVYDMNWNKIAEFWNW